MQLGLESDYIRKGEGSVLDPWDAPWENYTVAQGYHEPFPYGIIEKSKILTLKLKYHFTRDAIIQSLLCYRDGKNSSHIAGKNQNVWHGSISLSWNFGTELFF